MMKLIMLGIVLAASACGTTPDERCTDARQKAAAASVLLGLMCTVKRPECDAAGYALKLANDAVEAWCVATRAPTSTMRP